MWSKKPTPVRPGAGARAVEREPRRMSVSLVVRVIVGAGHAGILHRARASPGHGRRLRRLPCAPPSTRRAPAGPRPAPARRRRRRAARRRRRGAPGSRGGGTPAARAPTRSAPRRSSAGSGSSRRRSRRTPSRPRGPRRSQPAARTRGARRSAAGPTSSRCSGANASAKASAASIDGASASAIPAGSDVGRSAASSATCVGDGVQQRGRRRTSPRRRSRAVLALGEQVEGDEPRVGGPVGDDEHVAGAEEAVDPDAPGDLALGLLAVEVARAADDVDPPDLLGPVGERRDGVGAAHRVDLGDAQQRRGAGMTGCTGGGAETQTSSTPAARAVTTPMTSVEGSGTRPPGT